VVKVFTVLVDHCVLVPISCNCRFLGKALTSTEAPEVNLFGRSAADFELTCLVECDQIANLRAAA